MATAELQTLSKTLAECFALSRCCHILARLKLSLIFSYGMLNELICNMYHLLHICGINLLPSTPISSSLNPPQALYSHLKLFKPIPGPPHPPKALQTHLRPPQPPKALHTHLRTSLSIFGHPHFPLALYTYLKPSSPTPKPLYPSEMFHIHPRPV